MKRILMAVLCLTFVMASASFAKEVELGSSEDLSSKVVMVDTTNDPAFNHYKNGRFGFSIDIPATMDQADETSTKDGCSFFDSKSDVSVVIYGAENLMHMSVPELYNIDIISNNNPNVTYKQFGPNWYAVAWEKGKMTVYKKLISHGDYYNSFSVMYPTNEQAKYMPIIQHMNSTFAIGWNMNAR